MKNLAKISCLVFLLIATGCGQKPQPVSKQVDAAAVEAVEREKVAAQQRLLADLNRVFADANEAFSIGRTNEAIAQVEGAFATPRFASFRPQILDGLLRMMQHCVDDETLRQRVRATWNEPALARVACGFLYRYYRESGDTRRAADWSSEVLARTNFPQDIRIAACSWNLDDRIALNQDDQALGTLETATHTFPPKENVALFSQALESFFSASRTNAVERVLSLANGMHPCPPALANLILATQIRLQVAHEQWQELTHSFLAAITTLPDGDLERLLRIIAPAAKNAHQPQVIDRCAEAVLFTPAHTNSATVEFATPIWAENTLAADKAAFPGRLDALLRANIPSRFVADLLIRHYYKLVENPASLKEMMAVASRLVPIAEDEETRCQLKEKLLDGYFLSHDYDHAITLLQAGISLHDATWHSMMIAKLKAYQALDRKDAREAVKQFGVFADLARQWKDTDVYDPTSGLYFPKEVVLAHNAKRVGDILAGIPDAAEAAKAYAESRELYQQALAKSSDASAKKIMADEIARLPK
jgi:tetratricopeptide (TPR) repeat protein